jgi:hypothetical protein
MALAIPRSLQARAVGILLSNPTGCSSIPANTNVEDERWVAADPRTPMLGETEWPIYPENVQELQDPVLPRSQSPSRLQLPRCPLI